LCQNFEIKNFAIPCRFRWSIKKLQFYNAVIISYNAAIIFAHRYADKARELANRENNPTRKQELLQIAANCDRVPEYRRGIFPLS